VDRYVLMLIEHRTDGRRARELMYVTEIVIMYRGVCVCVCVCVCVVVISPNLCVR